MLIEIKFKDESKSSKLIHRVTILRDYPKRLIIFRQAEQSWDRILYFNREEIDSIEISYFEPK